MYPASLPKLANAMRLFSAGHRQGEFLDLRFDAIQKRLPRRDHGRPAETIMSGFNRVHTFAPSLDGEIKGVSLRRFCPRAPSRSRRGVENVRATSSPLLSWQVLT